MKKFIMTLLSLSFVGATAMAFEGALAPANDGNVTIHALKGICPEKPVAGGNYCKPTGNTCPAGYDQYAKLCWGGWKKGFYKCGISCKPKEQCGWNPHGEWRCGNPGHGGGHHAANFAGALKLTANGDVQVQVAKNICEEQIEAGSMTQSEVCHPADGLNCAPGTKRMHKYCWGGLKKGLYRCGYVCETPRTGGDGNYEAGQGE